MRVAVLTLALYVNYGGSLQAFALMRALKDLGHDAWFLNRETRIPTSRERAIRAAKRWLKKHLIGRFREIRWNMYDLEVRPAIMQHHARFIAQHIQPQTEAFLTSKTLAGKIGDYQFDAIVVGSDQVWRRDYILLNHDDYFLGFLATDDHKTRRVAYAASFGTSDWDYTDEETSHCGNLLRQFHAVSVREDDGVAMCRERFGVDADHVVDPTLLLEPHRYLELLPDNMQQRTFSGVLIYLLDETGAKGQIARSAIEALDRPGYRVSKPSADATLSLDKRVAPPIEEWVRGFLDADFVVTDSFHGVVFSILFNKRFIAIGNSSRGMSRFESLLRMFGLEDRLLSSLEDIDIQSFLAEPDWNRINDELDRQRRRSMDFLRLALTPEVAAKAS